MHKRKAIMMAALIALLTTSCLKNSDNNFNQALQNRLDDQALQTYLAFHGILANRDTILLLGGDTTYLYYVIDSVGSGDTVRLQDTITVHFRGRFLNDSTFAKADTTTLTTVLQNTIPAWQIGVQKITEGGGIEIYAPSVLCYGYYGLPPIIPSNTPLIYSIQLLDVKHAH
ncbi:FKBP-type peptidyl-prolyl cis-trans isomerase [Thermoflavifilum thermophilum]|uniref:Peptidyl-prolyl cis-trans isomerase n=1 Tax=Thermoflavifilum thermophilum TaxID=1393122 RepID=A0A1I7NJB2_9BACT|nr:FKBP-type peptidyl-prolyl cis-trans isomerase [Thermoflavifilum thermophilum]SFV34750.1 FKBP-type peptidyl-prolyl cis-trans isomerase [Thermoflavifilum thermophilum]